VGIIHLYTLGYREDDLLSFKLQLNNPSKISELQELEHWKQKFDIAAAATEGYFSKRWIAENLLGMSEDEFLRNQREMFFDKKYSAKLEAATAGGEAAEGDAGGGGLAGGLGDLGGAEGDLGGDLDLGGEGEDIAGETGGDEGGDTDLLAEPPPAKRDDPIVKPPTTKKGGVTKHLKNVARGGEHGTTKRTKFQGAYGYGSLNTMYEQMDKDEDRLFAVSRDVEVLLEGLFKKENEDETQ